MPRIHLLGPFNTPSTMADEGIGNAFGTKCVNMAKVLRMLGHHVIFYGPEGSEVECDEFVPVVRKETLRHAYGEWDTEQTYGCKEGDAAHKEFTENASREILKRKEPRDFLFCSHGSFHKPVADNVGIFETVEIGIGYPGSFARFRIFESEFQRSYTYGKEGRGDGNFYDAVIPGFFDPSDFEYREEKEDFYLYLGRIVQRKGVLIARDVCRKLGKKLVVAGFGTIDNPTDAAVFNEIKNDPVVEYVGFAGREKKRDLLSRAKAVFMPTTYLEPFGYVAIEAGFSGTPVITTDFGAFPETVKNGVNGWRCNVFRDFIEAAQKPIHPASCRETAMRYSLSSVATLYEAFCKRISDIYGRGWYE